MTQCRFASVLGLALAVAAVGCSNGGNGTNSSATGGSDANGGSAVSGGSEGGASAVAADGTGGSDATSAGAGGDGTGGTSGTGVTSDGGDNEAAVSGGGDGSPGGGGDGSAGSTPADAGIMSFFVSSAKSMTGNLGGLAGADKRCQDLGAAVGAGGKTWHAYLSVAAGPGGGPVNAKDRIGNGPWYNSSGALVGMSVADLHSKMGDHTIFIDEKGQPVPGQWNSATPLEHDILTGSKSDGTLLLNQTCKDWTSTSMADTAQVGHSDGLGPNKNSMPPYNSWNSAHANAGCNDTAPRGGAGRIYCFATN
jgi:hypothetical protein